MAEPLGVAFVEIEPVATGFRAKTEAQLRTALAGSTGAAKTATTAQQGLTAAENRGAASAERKAVAEGAAATATRTHAAASRTATGAMVAEATAASGLNRSLTGMSGKFNLVAAGVGALFLSLREADRFNEQMNRIEVSTGASADEMERARDVAIQYGRDLNIPLTTATEAATAIDLLTRSGFNLEEAQAAARGSLLLTAASGEELATSVKLTDQILDAFNLRAEDSVRVADALAAGLRFTGGSATEAGQGIASLAPIADSLGLSLEEVNTLVLQLGESGLETARGTAALRQSLLRLGTPTVAKALGEAGISMNVLLDAQGQLRPDAFARLAEALEDVSGAERRRILTQAFGARSALAVIRLVEQQRAGYNRMSAAARDAGAAQAEAESRTKSFGGTLSETKDNAADLGRQLGAVTTGPATAYVGMLGDILKAADDLAFAVGALAGVVGDVGGAFLDAIPGGERFFGVLQKGILLQAFPVFGIAKGISTIVGHFRKGEEDIDDILGELNTEVSNQLDELAATLQAKGQQIGSIAGQIGTTLGTQLAVAEATGSDADQLAILRQQRANAMTRLRRNERRTDLTPAQRNAQITQAANDVAAADAKIDAILAAQQAKSAAALSKRTQAAQDAATEAERKANEIAAAADRRDQAFIRAIQAGQADREGRASAAASTPQLGDDIRADVKLRNFLTRSITATRARIRQVRAAGRSAEALVAELADLRRSRNQVRREIERLQADAKQQAADTRVESAELDVEFATIGAADEDNRTQRSINKEVASRQKLIRALRKAQDLTKRGTVEWKQYRNRIAEEQAAIAALKKQRAQGQASLLALQKQEFAFLQTMHGFSANLISNLIPGGMTSGLVGGSSSGGAPGRVGTTSTATLPAGIRGDRAPGPGDRLGGPQGIPRTAVSGGAATRSVTSAQGNTQIMLLRGIRAELARLNRGAEHPEAHQQRRTGSAAGDNSYQGTHGM
jgi:TP901 family phage tail tape measure protein